MSNKTWSDQPDECAGPEVTRVAEFGLRDGYVAEIRRLVDNIYGSYYVTIGNLFGSCTVFCPNADAVFQILEVANKSLLRGKPSNVADLPKGAQIVPNEDDSYHG